jgi:hypothetical protein
MHGLLLKTLTVQQAFTRTDSQGARGVAQEVECLFCKLEALGSIPVPPMWEAEVRESQSKACPGRKSETLSENKLKGKRLEVWLWNSTP